MSGPSSVPGEHCAPCGFSEIDTGEVRNIHEHRLESHLVKIDVEELKRGIKPAESVQMGTPAETVVRRHKAAMSCAERIVAGECELFCAVRSLHEGYKVVPN